MQPVECVFCQNIIDNETESDREPDNPGGPDNDQEIFSENLPPEMDHIQEEYYDRDDDDRLPSLEVLPRPKVEAEYDIYMCSNDWCTFNVKVKRLDGHTEKERNQRAS